MKACGQPIVGLILLFAIPASVFLWVLGLPDGLFHFDEHSTAGPVISPYLMSIAMLAGILFGVTYEELRAVRAVKFRLLLGNILGKPGLYRALVAAPIVFSGVYAFAQSSADPVIAAVFAFQNGFFCEALLKHHTVKKPP
jgi:hypothetical protein